MSRVSDSTAYGVSVQPDEPISFVRRRDGNFLVHAGCALSIREGRMRG